MGIGQISPSVSETAIGDDPAVSLTTGYALSKYIGMFLPLLGLTKTNERQWSESPSKHTRF